MQKLLLRLTFSICVISGGLMINSYSNGNFNSDLTGSPLSSGTCQGCHGSTSGSGSVGMTIPTNYYPGADYDVSLTINASTAEYGFMAGVLRDNNANGGTFTAGTGTSTTTISSRSYIKHSSGSTSGSWSFDWTAPSYADTIIFYYVGNAANGNNGTSGDIIYFGNDTILPLPLITYTKDSTNVSCANDCDGAASVSGVGGGQGGPYTYSWSTGGTSSSVTGLCSGSYTLTITDSAGNEEVVDFSIDQPSPLAISFQAQGTSCVNSQGMATSDVQGGTTPYSYLWSNGAQDSTIMNLAVGTYTLTVTDANGCVAIDSIEILNEGSGFVAFIQDEPEECGQANGSLSISMFNGTAPFTFNWSDGSTTSTASNLEEGIYTVTVTDANGCTDVFSDTVFATFAEIDEPGTTIDDLLCFGDSNGSISLAISQGVAPFTYTWSNGDQSDNPNDLTAGVYSVTLTDDVGCADTAEFEVEEPTELEVTATPDSSNQGFCDGTIELTAQGGTGAYSYSWSHDAGETGSTASGLCEGTYSITVTDENGCEEIIEVRVGSVTGVSNVNGERVKAFPNPSSDFVTMSGISIGSSVYLVDLAGRQLKEWSVTGEQQRFDVSDIAAGRYTLQHQTDEGIIQIALIIQ